MDNSNPNPKYFFTLALILIKTLVLTLSLTAILTLIRGCVVYPYRSSDEEALFMVLDGHGEQGDRISEFVMRQVSSQSVYIFSRNIIFSLFCLILSLFTPSLSLSLSLSFRPHLSS
jgi:hypothetical protein